MPNPVARSSLFAPIARGKKKMRGGTVLASRADASLEYWGVQLNEQHADISLQLLYEARCKLQIRDSSSRLPTLQRKLS